MDIKTLLASKLSSSCFTIRLLPKKSSWVFKYFGNLYVRKPEEESEKPVAESYVFCNVCLTKSKEKEDAEESDSIFGGKLQYYSATTATSNLAKHLEVDHKLVSPEQPGSKRRSQYDLGSYFIPQPKKAGSATDKKWRLARDMAMLCCRTLCSFNFVTGDGLATFLMSQKVINHPTEVPDATTVSGAALRDVYASARKEVDMILKHAAPKWGCITCDMWTDRYKRNPYITVTLHFINSSFELKSINLSTRLIPSPHTAENINKQLDEILKEFDLMHIELTATTDAGRNIIKALRDRNMEGMVCFGHAIQNLVIHDGISKVPALRLPLAKAKKCAVQIKYRAPELEKELEHEEEKTLLARVLLNCEAIEDLLESSQLSDQNVSNDENSENEDDETSDNERDEEQTPIRRITVKLYSETRWHGMLILLESLGNARHHVNSILIRLDKCEYILTESEWNLLDNLKCFLKDFKTAVELLSCEKDTTVEKVLVFYAELKSKLVIKQGDPPSIKSLKKCMTTGFEKRFKVTDRLVCAGLLDPKNIHLSMIQDFCLDLGQTPNVFLLEKLRRFMGVDAGELHVEEGDEAAADHPDARMSGIMDIILRHSVAAPVEVDQAREEVLLFFKIASKMLEDLKSGVHTDCNTLSFWRKNAVCLPNLAKMATKFLCQQATSTPSERAFSSAGLLLVAKRSRLSPINVEKILFVHDNYSLLKEGAIL